MDKISYYNSLVELENSSDNSTENFLEGIRFYFHNIEFIYTFVRAISKKYNNKVEIHPSFVYHKDNNNELESTLKQMFFRIKDEDNKSITEMLNTKLSILKNRHGEVSCEFVYEKESDRIQLVLHEVKLNKGEIRSVTKNQYS